MASTRRGGSRVRAQARTLPRPRASRGLDAVLPPGRSVAVGLALVVLAAGAYAAARLSPLFAVGHVEVVGGTPAIAEQVREALAPDLGSSLLALDRGLLARVEALPDVRAASYDRAFPHTLVVRVERELPAAVLRRGPGSWLLSARGRVLRPIARGAHPRLPRVWVGKGPDTRPGTVLAEPQVAVPMRVVRALPVRLSGRVRSVGVRRGATVARLDGGVELRLGEPVDLAAKLAVAATILPDLPRPGAGGPSYLDVSLPERPVTGTNSQPEGRA